MIVRHMKRHEEKDRDAGGAGLGKLISRRKVWRPSVGYITGNKNSSKTENQMLKEESLRENERFLDDKSNSVSDSSANMEPNQRSLMCSPDLKLNTETKITGSDESCQNVITVPEVSCSFHVESQPDNHKKQDSNYLDVFDDFIPDTGSSFSMPFTTIKDYSWMFDNLSTSLFQSQDNDIAYVSPESIDLDMKGNMISMNEDAPNKAYENFYSLPYSYETGTNDNTVNKNENPEIEKVVEYNSRNLTVESDLCMFSKRAIPELHFTTCNRAREFICSICQDREVFRLRAEMEDFLSHNSMHKFFKLFFTNINNTYPLIHAPSFNSVDVHSMLLVSIIVLGASYSEQPDHKIAVKIHDLLRGVIFSSDYFDATPELWVLQSILLIEVFGRNKAGMKQMGMSHLFHGLLINLIRRSGYQSIVIDRRIKDLDDLNKSWKEWIKLESMKRLVFLTFLWDVQHAVLFSQTLCMSAFELKLELPSDANIWLADNEEEWASYYSSLRCSPILFLKTLKKYLNCSSELPEINSFSRVLILHGLMGIAWDMQRRDQTSLGFQIDPNTWKIQLSKAYYVWKDDFDIYCSDLFLGCAKKFEQAFIKRSLLKYISSINAIFHCAHIMLWTNTVDLQIFAGAKHILGRNVMPTEYESSSRQFQKWIQNVGKPEKALFHAIELLKEGLVSLEDWEHDGSFHYPWCVYISALLCWGYYEVLQLEANDLQTVRKPYEDMEIHASLNKTPESTTHSENIDLKNGISMSNCIHVLGKVTPDRYRNINCDFQSTLTDVSKYLGTIRWGVIYESNKVLQNIIDNKN